METTVEAQVGIGVEVEVDAEKSPVSLRRNTSRRDLR